MDREQYIGCRGLLRSYEAVEFHGDRVTLYWYPEGSHLLRAATATMRHEPVFGWCLDHDGNDRIVDDIPATAIDPRNWRPLAMPRNAARMLALDFLRRAWRNLRRSRRNLRNDDLYVYNLLRQNAAELLTANP